jgi:nitrogen fixation-related uncharacterized protein
MGALWCLIPLALLACVYVPLFWWMGRTRPGMKA